MRKAAIAFLLLIVGAACVTAQRPADNDFSHLKVHDALGLKLRLPGAFKRFEEAPAVAFRPDPPTRTSPGVLVLRYTGRTPTQILDEAFIKVRDKMGGEPLPVRGVVGGREVMGIHAELFTHLIWIYAIPAGGAVYLLQIAAPVTWNDETVLAFHDLVCRGVTLPPEPAPAH
jgi:hypothetical protein